MECSDCAKMMAGLCRGCENNNARIAAESRAAEASKESAMLVASWHEMWKAVMSLAKKINSEKGIPGIKVVEAKQELDEVFRVALRQQQELSVPVGEREHIGWMARAEKAEKERDGYRERVASLFDALDEAHEHLLDGGPCSSHGPHEDEGCLYCEMMSKISEALTPRPAAGEKP